MTTSPGDLKGALADLTSRIEKKMTVPEQVAGALRELIVGGGLKPGDPVVESQLAKQLRVGQPTVREALKVLEHEGLIERNPNRGCTVTRLAQEDLDQIFFLRRHLEPLAVQLAADSWNDDKAAKIMAAYLQLQRAAEAGDTKGYFDADVAFHEVLWEVSGNRYLKKTLCQLVLPMFAFFVLDSAQGPRFNLRENAAGHRSIMDALVAKDGARAAQAMRDSLDTFAQITG